MVFHYIFETLLVLINNMVFHYIFETLLVLINNMVFHYIFETLLVLIHNMVIKRLLKFFDFTAVSKLFILQHESYIYIHTQT